MSASRFAFALSFAILLTGCGDGPFGDSGDVFQHLSIDDGNVAVHARGAGDAIVQSDGTLVIDGKVVTTTTAQRELLAHFHAQALKLRSDGVAVGRAGIKTAGKAIGGVIAGLAKRDPNTIDDKVNAQAREVEARAAELCNTLRDLRSTQDAIAAQLPAFQPYATIGKGETDHCH